jgi:hypothetical protein
MWRFYDMESGEFWVPTCRTLSCPYCIETLIWQTGRAFELAAPERYAVFTLVSGDWQTDRLKIKALHKRLDRDGFEVHSAYTVEENPKLTGFHLNFWWHGSYIPQDQLSEAAVSLGWGQRVRVEGWRGSTRVYGLKEASSSTYGMKEAQADDLPEGGKQWTLTQRQAAYLARNGGKLLGSRRSFWRDGPGGDPLGGKQAAVGLLRTRSRSTPTVPRSQEWVLSAGPAVLAHSPVASSAV